MSWKFPECWIFHHKYWRIETEEKIFRTFGICLVSHRSQGKNIKTHKANFPLSKVWRKSLIGKISNVWIILSKLSYIIQLLTLFPIQYHHFHKMFKMPRSHLDTECSLLLSLEFKWNVHQCSYFHSWKV